MQYATVFNALHLILAHMGALPCTQASQCGLVVRPAKGFGSRWRLGRGGVGSRGGGHTAVSLGHAHWSMTHSHTRAISPSW
jgi:hypothetical protein